MRTPVLACSLVLALGGSTLLGQEANVKPIFIAAIAPVDDLIADVDYLTKVVGQPDTGKMVRQFAGPILGGVDRTRPWGAYVTLEQGEAKSIGFIPMKSLDTQLEILEAQIGKPEKLDGGIVKVTLPPGVGEDENGPRSIYLKEQDGWAFTSDKPEHLAALPKDPVAILGGLEKKYDLGVRFLVENVPAEDREKFVDELKQGFKQKREETPTGSTEIPEEVMQAIEEAFLSYAEGTKSVDVGFTIDPQQANVSLSLVIEPIAGSELAKSLASVQSLTTPHSGVLVPGGAYVIHRAAKFTPKEVALWDAFIDQMLKEAPKEQAEVQADAPAIDPAFQKEVLALLERLIKSAHSDGTVDWGSSYIVNEEGMVTSVGGFHLADLKKNEADVRAFLEKHKATQPRLAKLDIQWDFARHGNVRIAKMAIPEGAPVYPKVYGDDPSFYLGFADNYLYMATGHESLEHLKAAIDRSAAKPAFKAYPLRVRIDARPLMPLAVKQFGSDHPAVEKMVAQLEESKGKTSINVSLMPSQAGLEGRLEVGEGVLKVAAAGVQLFFETLAQGAQPGLQPPGAFPPAPADAPRF